MSRFTAAVAALIALTPFASAGPVPTWGYTVYTGIAPNPILASGQGLAAGEVVHLGPVVGRPVLGSPWLPDPATHHADTYFTTDSTSVMLIFHDEVSGTNTYDSVGWGVRREWRRVAGPNGPEWDQLPNSYDQPYAGYGDNYAGYYDWQEGRYIWNRYDAVVGADGSLTLSMTPDVGVNPRFVPEPGTLVLGGVGLAGLLAAGRRKWVARRYTNTSLAHG